MTDAQKTIAQFKKATTLANQTFRANGPKSFKSGLGALIVALQKNGGTMTQRELVDVLGMGRKGVKTIVKKGMRSDLLTITEAEEPKTYNVSLTEEGKAVAEKRMISDAEVAASILAGFSEEEIAQLNALTEKIILNVKELGIKGARKSAFKHHRGAGKGFGHRKCCRKHGHK